MSDDMLFDDKLLLTKMRIQQWYEHWDSQVYVAFSGGKDSTVLLHLVRSMYPEVVGAFNNTGLEFPEIKEFVKQQDNIIWLRPTMNYQKVVEKYGFAVVSKEVSQKVNELKYTKSEKLRDIRLNGNTKGHGKLAKKWVHLKDAPFDISHKCCDILKKNPAKVFEGERGLKPMVGVMAYESNLRKVKALTEPCNMYDAKRPVSKPLNLWSEEDIYTYLGLYDIKISEIYSKGYDRTGCAWCAFGVHLETGENRFQRMKRTHPNIWKYAIYKMGLNVPLTYIGVDCGMPSRDRAATALKIEKLEGEGKHE